MMETNTIFKIMIKLIPGNSEEFRGTPGNSGEIPRRFRGDSGETPGNSGEFRGIPGNYKIWKNTKTCSKDQQMIYFKWNPSTFGLNVETYCAPKRIMWILTDFADFKL